MAIYQALSPLEVAVSQIQACYTVHPSSGEVIVVVFGENGFHHSTVKADNRQLAERKVRELNTELGISEDVEDAMVAGSMFHWNCRAAEAARLHFGSLQ